MPWHGMPLETPKANAMLTQGETWKVECRVVCVTVKSGATRSSLYYMYRRSIRTQLTQPTLFWSTNYS